MNLTLNQLHDFVRSAVDAGIQNYIKGVEPLSDKINQTEAKKWIASRGFKPVMLRKWVNAGLLSEKKSGSNKNSQTFYSKAEIKNLLTTISFSNIINQS